MRENDLQIAKYELFEAIAYFVKRQEIVAQALLDIGLDLDAMAVLGAGGWILGAEGAKRFYGVAANDLNEKFRNALQGMIENKAPKLNQTGIWQEKNGENWTYFMHGGGCRLTNQITGEPIDWDCPSTLRFDTFKFAFHVEWQLERFSDKYTNLKKLVSMSDINTVIYQLISELAAEDKLIKDSTYLYRIS